MNKRQKAKKAGYDSYFELELHQGPLQGADYHTEKIRYEVPSRYAWYEPDFSVNSFMVEAKGRFRNRSEMDKYKHINTALKDTDKKLIFIFDNPDLPLPGAQRRKDGTKRSHADWADNLGIKWLSKEDAHLIWEEK